MNQIRLSELLPGKAFQWPEFFVRNIPNTRLESGVIREHQCFRYLHYHTELNLVTPILLIHHKLLHDIRKFRDIPLLPSCCK